MLFFFFDDTAPTEIYTLSLHDALPICTGLTKASTSCTIAFAILASLMMSPTSDCTSGLSGALRRNKPARSEEHTSELQSQSNLVCRLLLEKKKKKKTKAKATSSRRCRV